MDGLTFTAEMAKAAAWPIAVLALALIYRPQLRLLFARLSKGRLGPAEFEFERELQVLAAQSLAGGAAPAGGTAAAIMPTAGAAREAILAAWRDLEHTAQAAQLAVAQMAAPDLALYQQLRALRAQAIERVDFNPSAAAANTYVQLARGLRARIDKARAERRQAS